MRLVSAGGRILYSRIWQVLANAAVVFVVAQTLGPTGQGHYSLTVAVAQLASALLAGGMGIAAVPPLRRGLVAAPRMVAVQTTWIVLMAAVLALVAAATLGPGPAAFLREQLGWSRGVGFLAALAALGLLIFEVFSYDLLARGRLVIGAAVNGWRATGHLLVVAALAGAGALGFGRTVGAFAAAQFLGALTLAAILLREIRRPPPATASAAPDVPPDRGAGTERLPAGLGRRPLWRLIAFNLRRGWVGQLSAVAYFLLLRLDQALVLKWHGAAEVGVYSVAVHVGEMLWLLPGAMTPLLVHTSAAAATDPDRDRTASRAVRLGLLVTAAAALPLALAAGPLLPLLAGGAFSESAAALRALLPGIVAFAPGAVLSGDFIGRGKPHWNTQASLLTVAINLGAGLLLVPAHGAIGAAWSSSLAYACGSLLMLFRFRQATGLTFGSLLRRRAD